MMSAISWCSIFRDRGHDVMALEDGRAAIAQIEQNAAR
jgi:hypothetical protein